MEKLVRLKNNLYLRNEPNRSAIGTLVSAGTILKCVESVKGELVEGVDDWYKNENGLYFWTGCVEAIKNEALNFIWPLERLYKRITTPFSENWILNNKKKHTGIDIAVPAGEKVFVVANCVVERIGYLDAEKKMAQYVGVKHESGDFCTAYLHINPSVKVGDRLKAGDVVGQIAKLIDMGAHLHFNIWNGAYDHSITHRGALPSVENVGTIEPKSDPAFPSNFIDPTTIDYI